MEVLDVRQQIRDGKVDNLYVFTGEEVAIQSAYVRKIAEVSGCQLKLLYSIADLFGNHSASKLFKSRFCYVLYEDPVMLKREDLWGEKLYGALGNNMLIMQYSNLDKRSKFYNAFKDRIVDFKYLPDTILLKYLHKDTNLSKAYAKRLIEICENDYSRIKTEVQKIKIYADEAGISEDESLKTLVEKDVIYVPLKDNVFDFVDSVSAGRVTDAFKMLDICKRREEPTLVMISLLYSQLKKVLQVQGCESKDIEKTTGLTDWEIKNSKQYCGNYSNRELVNALKLLHEVDKAIKTGLIDDNICMDYLMIKILGSWE